jgi:hypothetical protein
MGKRIIAIFGLGLAVGLTVGWWAFTGRIRIENLPDIPYIDTIPAPPSPPPEPPPDLFDLRPILQELPEDELLIRFPNDAYLTLVGRLESGDLLGTREEESRAKALLSEVRAHLDRLRSDLFYQASYVVAGNLARHPILKDYTVTSAESPPWFVSVIGGDRERDGDRALAEATAQDLLKLYRQFHTLFEEHLNLPELPSRERLDQRVLKVIIFRTRRLLEAYRRDSGKSGGEGLGAYYQVTDHLSVAFGSLDDPESRTDLRFIAAHQLMYAYRRLLRERKSGVQTAWGATDLGSRFPLLRNGLAQWLASGLSGETVIEDLKTSRKRKVKGWSLEELVSLRSQADVNQTTLKWWRPEGRPLALFDAECWSFVHFLLHFEDGKYRQRFFALAEFELGGLLDPEGFREVFWPDGEPDMEALEKQWRRHVDGLLKD